MQGNRTRERTAGTSLSFRWFSTVRTAPGAIKQSVAQSLAADPRRMGLSKVLLNPRHPAVKAINEHRGRMREVWVRNTLPYVEPGIRLALRENVADLADVLDRQSIVLTSHAHTLDAHRSELIADAQDRLGAMFNPGDYPDSFVNVVGASFRVWDLELPSYLRDLAGGAVYDRQMAEVMESFRISAELAEQAFAGELLDMVTHLRERLEGSADDAPRIFRDSAVNNLREFFTRFRSMDIESGPELRAQVEALEGMLQGVTPNGLRSSPILRERLREEMGRTLGTLETLTETGPARRLTRLGNVDAPAAQ